MLIGVGFVAFGVYLQWYSVYFKVKDLDDTTIPAASVETFRYWRGFLTSATFTVGTFSVFTSMVGVWAMVTNKLFRSMTFKIYFAFMILVTLTTFALGIVILVKRNVVPDIVPAVVKGSYSTQATVWQSMCPVPCKTLTPTCPTCVQTKFALAFKIIGAGFVVVVPLQIFLLVLSKWQWARWDKATSPEGLKLLKKKPKAQPKAYSVL